MTGPRAVSAVTLQNPHQHTPGTIHHAVTA